MFICFAEYRIMPEYRERYLAETARLLRGCPGTTLYEGTDQPNLFVEIWPAATLEEADRIKKERCGERSSWSVVTPWIAGGEAKLHVWTFKPAGT